MTLPLVSVIANVKVEASLPRSRPEQRIIQVSLFPRVLSDVHRCRNIVLITFLLYYFLLSDASEEALRQIQEDVVAVISETHSDLAASSRIEPEP